MQRRLLASLHMQVNENRLNKIPQQYLKQAAQRLENWQNMVRKKTTFYADNNLT